MKASIVTLKEGAILIANTSSVARGLRLPYLSKFGLPVFMLDTEEPHYKDDDEYTILDAAPGMIGINQRGEDVYVIDAEGNAQLLPLQVVIKGA